MLQDAILQCETPTKFTPEAQPRRVGPKRRGRARESRSRFVNMDDQWTFQCQVQKRHPLRGETSTDETTPKPDRPRPHLGRNRVLAYGPVCFAHSRVSGASASVRLMIQRHSARQATSEIRQLWCASLHPRPRVVRGLAWSTNHKGVRPSADDLDGCADGYAAHLGAVVSYM